MPSRNTYCLKGRTPVLTKNDKYVPSGYIGIYSIFRNPQNRATYVSEKVCQNMRKRTFDAVFFLCKQYKSPSFANLFNYNAQVIGETGLNFFSEHDEIYPISSIIECFETKFRSNRQFIYISFGIKKSLLEKYFETGVCPKIDHLQTSTRDAAIYGLKDIKFFADTIIKVPKNKLYIRFLNWCKARNISESDALTIAMSLLVRKYGASSEKSLEEYEPITILDRNLFSKTARKEAEIRRIYFSGIVLSQAEKIINRWNRDPDNAEKKKMDFETYCNNALALLNKSMPEKYTDDNLFYKYLESKSKIDRN